MKKTKKKKKSASLKKIKFSFPKGTSFLKKALPIIIAALAIPAITVLAGQIKVGHWAFSFSKNRFSQDEAAQMAKDFIGQKILKGKEVEISQVQDRGDVFSFKIEIPNQGTFTSYITKDGRFIFPSGYNTDELKEEEKGEQEEKSSQNTQIPKTDNPSALLFTMSFCPFGNQAEEGIIPAVNLLKKDITVEPHYVIYSNYSSGYPKYCLDKENKYCSMHGIGELNQDVRELCVYKYQKDKYWDFVQQINKDCTAQNVDTCWTKSAKKVGVNIAKISQCQKNEAYSLLAKEVELNKKYNVKGSPDLVINEAKYQGGRSPENYKNALCPAFKQKPEECSTVLGESTSKASGSCN